MSRTVIRGLCVFSTVLGAAGVACSQPAGKQHTGWVEVLQEDARLNVKITFTSEARPTSEQILDHVRKATGVPLSLAGDREKGTVLFGGTAVVNVPAWKVMQQLAKTQVSAGRWEKAGDGYVLHGTPRDFGITPERLAANEALRKVAEAKRARAAKAAAEFAKYHPLGLDPRLRPRLSVVEKHPPLAELLERLGACTGLRFTLDANLSHHDPDLGHLQMPNVPAYTIMEVIARHDLENGR